MKHLFRIVPVLAAVFILQAGIEKKGSFDITEYKDTNPAALTFQTEYKKGSFDINILGGKTRNYPS